MTLSQPQPNVPPLTDTKVIEAEEVKSKQSVQSGRMLAIERGEYFRTLLLFLLLMIGSIIFVMGRTARDAIFLTHFPVTWIAYMWVGYGLLSPFVAVGYGRFSSRTGRRQLAIGVSAFSAVTYAAVRILIAHNAGWAIAFFSVWAEIVSNLFIMVAWTVINDLHDPRSAKRLFGPIGAGRMIGFVAAGLGTSELVRTVGTANLLWVLVGLMGLFAWLSMFIAARFDLPKAPPAKHTGVAVRTAPMSSQHKRYAMLIALMLFAAFLILTIGDYQFKAIAKLQYPNQDNLARYMALFYAGLGVVAFVFQFFITPKILRKFGVAAGMLVMPVAFCASTTALIFFPQLSAATAQKMSDNGLQYTIHDATMQVLYFAFPQSLRNRVRAWLDAAAKPLGCSLAGVTLMLIAPAPFAGETPLHLMARIGHVGWLSLGIGAIWIALVPLVRRSYVASLRASLVRRQSDMHDELDTIYDAATHSVLLEATHSRQPAQVAYAIEQLAALEPEALKTELDRLCHHENGIVRALALRQASELGYPNAAQLAREAIGDPRARVASAAIESLGIASPDDAVDELAPFVDDDSRPILRNAAISTLIRFGGLSGMLAGGARLQAMRNSQAPKDRMAAARIFQAVGNSSLARSLRALLSDRDRGVRLAALDAARSCVSPSLVPALIDALGERGSDKRAIHALAATGQAAVAELDRRLGDQSEKRQIRMHIPRALQAAGTNDALDRLLGHIGDSDEGVRQRILASASRLREQLNRGPVEFSRLRPIVRQELRDHVALRTSYFEAARWLWRPLLVAQIKTELRANLVRVLRACELAYSRSYVAVARREIFSHETVRRANALEMLDNVLDGHDREAILEIADHFGSLSWAEPPAPMPGAVIPDSVAKWAHERCGLQGQYRLGVFLEAIGFNHVTALAPIAFSYVRAEHPFMRENALIALAACQPPHWRDAIQAAADDESPTVRAYARYVNERQSAGLDPEDDMYTTVEKILFLQGVPIFAGVAGHDLMPLALQAEVVRFSARSRVFSEGDPGDALYVVIHGSVDIVRGSKSVAVLGQGEVFGEMAILDQAPRLTDAIVSSDADLLKVSADDFEAALDETTAIAANVIRVLSERLRKSADRYDVILEDTEGRKTVV